MSVDTAPVEQTPETQEDNLRGALEAAFDQHASEPETHPAAPSETPAAPTAPVVTEQPRDEHGRFTARQEGAPPAKPGDHGAAPGGETQPAGGAKPTPPTPPAGPAAPKPAQALAPPAPVVEPPERPPQSWKPTAREHWPQLPSDVRQEVLRREREISATLQESTEDRRLAAQFRETVRPFETLIRAEGSEPLRAVAALMRTAAALRVGSPLEKARQAAAIIQGYGVSLDMLAQLLEGQQPGPEAQQGYDPRIDQLMQRFDRFDQFLAGQQQQQVRSYQDEIEAFGKDKEFFEDIRPYMATAVEIAARHGEKLTLDQAWERALAMRPDIREILQQREAAKKAETTRAATQRSIAATSSIRNNPTQKPPVEPENRSLRDDLEASIESLSGRT